jgi:hypothetical protein
VVLLTLVSCIKDEPRNNECDITAAWVEGEQYEAYFYDVSQMRHDAIMSNEDEIVFNVRSMTSLSRQIPVSFTLTEGATIEPANGSMQDFTAGPVTYTVTSEDGQWQRHYTVVFKEPSLPSSKFSFEHIDSVTMTSGSQYHVFYEIGADGSRQNVWASGNAGAGMTIAKNSRPSAFPTSSTTNGYEGRGVCLKTISTGSLGSFIKKPIAAGNLYLGKFNVDSVLVKPLKATQFGIVADKVPVRITGYYKYQPGKEFTDKNMKIVEGRTDEATIYAVFYRNKDEHGRDVFLYGNDVQTNPYIVSKAIVTSLPPTSEYTRFEAFFQGGTIDADILADKGYNLTVVFSSSKGGDLFEGAIGSVLYVDEVEITYEE